MPREKTSCVFASPLEGKVHAGAPWIPRGSNFARNLFYWKKGTRRKFSVGELFFECWFTGPRGFLRAFVQWRGLTRAAFGVMRK